MWLDMHVLIIRDFLLETSLILDLYQLDQINCAVDFAVLFYPIRCVEERGKPVFFSSVRQLFFVDQLTKKSFINLHCDSATNDSRFFLVQKVFWGDFS